MIIKFIEVGRNKTSWKAASPAKDINELEYDWLYSQVKKRGYVMSKYIEFLLNKDGINGIITAGFHTIGKFKIEQI